MKQKNIILYHTFPDDMKAATIKRFWCSFQTILNRHLEDLETNVILHEGLPDKTFLDKNTKQTSNTRIVFDDFQQISRDEKKY